MRCTVEPLTDGEALAARWQAVEARAHPSVFQSWGWIGTWLRTMPATLSPLLLSVHDEAGECGLAVICRHRRRRHGWLVSDGLFLNETGDPALDALTIEFNGVLAVKGVESRAAAAAIRHLTSAVDGWDELYLSGIVCAPDRDYVALTSGIGLTPHLLSEQPCDYVDLDTVRSGGGDYLSGLSKNTRYQIRRSLRRYEERGALTIRVAASLEEAMTFFSRMKALHQAYWLGRGEPGAFANPMFEDFHRAYIAGRFSSGEIHLVRIAAGDDDIGFLYNILHDGHIYSYQSGFVYEADAAVKPGLVSHYLAICDAEARGVRIYDFMAGAGQHKMSLGTHRREMVWLAARRPRLRFRLENSLRDIKHAFDRWFSD